MNHLILISAAALSLLIFADILRMAFSAFSGDPGRRFRFRQSVVSVTAAILTLQACRCLRAALHGIMARPAADSLYALILTGLCILLFFILSRLLPRGRS